MKGFAFFGSRSAAAGLWSIAALIAAIDVAVALELKPDSALHFAAVLALCAGMAVWSRVSVVR